MSYRVVVQKRLVYQVDVDTPEEARALAITAANGELQEPVRRRKVTRWSVGIAVESCERLTPEPPPP
jgi:hypothetical protein